MRTPVSNQRSRMMSMQPVKTEDSKVPSYTSLIEGLKPQEQV